MGFVPCSLYCDADAVFRLVQRHGDQIAAKRCFCAGGNGEPGRAFCPVTVGENVSAPVSCSQLLAILTQGRCGRCIGAGDLHLDEPAARLPEACGIPQSKQGEGVRFRLLRRQLTRPRPVRDVQRQLQQLPRFQVDQTGSVITLAAAKRARCAILSLKDSHTR